MDLDESILSSLKRMLGLTNEITGFDEEIGAHINSVFTTLNQLDVGSDDGFMITGFRETWRDYVEDIRLATMIREYIYLKVRMIFDPPASSVVADAYNSRMAELEWRLNIQAERIHALAEQEGAEP